MEQHDEAEGLHQPTSRMTEEGHWRRGYFSGGLSRAQESRAATSGGGEGKNMKWAEGKTGVKHQRNSLEATRTKQGWGGSARCLVGQRNAVG